jgi:hypothetical protein
MKYGGENMRAWVIGMLLGVISVWLGLGAASSAGIFIRQYVPVLSLRGVIRKKDLLS